MRYGFYKLSFWIRIVLLLLFTNELQGQKLFSISPDIKGGAYDFSKFFTSACDSTGIFVLGEYPYFKDGDSTSYVIQSMMFRFDYEGNLLFQKKLESPDSVEFKVYAWPSKQKNDSIYFFHWFYLFPGDELYKSTIAEINIRNGHIEKLSYLPKKNELTAYSLGNFVYDESRKQLVFPTNAFKRDSNVNKLYTIALDSNLNIVKGVEFQVPGFALFMNKGIGIGNDGHSIIGYVAKKLSTYYYQTFPVFIRIDSSLVVKDVVIRRDLESFAFRADNFSPVKDLDGNWVMLMSKDTISEMDSNQFNSIPYILKFNARGDSLLWKTRMQNPAFKFYDYVFFHPAMGRCKDGSGYIGLEDSWERGVNSYIRMFKVSETGDSLWSRYHYILGPEVKTWYNELNPIVSTPYNTFVTQGSGGIRETGQFRPWLLHFDYHGCVVPGCHLQVQVNEEEQEEQQAMQIYPNPPRSGDMLYLLARTGLGQKADLSIMDTNGRKFSSHAITLQAGAQYVLQLPENMVAGTYLIQIEDGRNVWNTKLQIFGR